MTSEPRFNRYLPNLTKLTVSNWDVTILQSPSYIKVEAMNENLQLKSDEDLMLLYQEGDSLAFQVLFERHSGRILAYLRRRASAETANELLQDVFEKLHRSRLKYDRNYPFLPWVFTITRNTWIDHLKRQEIKVQNNTVSLEESSMSLDQLSQASSPAMTDAFNFDLNNAQLSEAQKLYLDQRYQKDWSFSEIAKFNQTTEQNVRQMISRAIRKIRTTIVRPEDK